MARLLLILVICGVLGMTSPARAATPARQPAAVGYVSSLNGLLEDVNYILTTGGRPELIQGVAGIISNLNELKGIDRTQPVGFYVFVPFDLGGKKPPEVIAFLPITSIDDLKQTAHLSNVLSLDDAGTANRYEFKTPEKNFSVRVEAGHAFIAEKAELLEATPQVPTEFTSKLAGQYDVVLQLRREGVPKLLWDLAIIGALNAPDRQLKELKKQTDAKSQAQYKALEIGRKVVVTTLDEARSIVFGLNISKEHRTAALDVKFETKPSGKVAQALARMAEQPSKLAHASLDLPASFHLAINLESDVRQAIVENIAVARSSDVGLSQVPEPIKTSLNSVFDVATKTLEAGRVELLLQFTGEAQTGMTLVGGLHVADGQAVGKALQTLLPITRESDQVENVTLDAGMARGVSFARVEGKGSRPGEELIYGGKPSLYLGTDPSALWFLVGDADAVTDFESLAGEPATARAETKAFAQFHLHLADWLGVLGASEDTKTKEFTEAARSAIKDPDRDAIHMILAPEDDGLRLSLTLDEAFLTLLGSRIGKD